jgi:hypothetical protein
MDERRAREKSEPEASSATELPLDEIVPARAVLTELARGFLLSHANSPQRATQFAVTFLNECNGGIKPAARVVPLQRAAIVRRGVSRSLHDESSNGWGRPPTD